MSIEKRNEIQDESVQVWYEKGKSGTIVMPTGAGKNFVALKIAKNYKGKVLHLAERTDREDTFKAEIVKFKEIFGVEIPNITYACYQSAYKWENTSWDLVIADEIHDSLSPEYLKFYLNNQYNDLVGLTATPDLSSMVDEKTKGEWLSEIAPIVYTLSIEDARKYGMLPELKVYTILHKLDNTKKVIDAGNKKHSFKTTELKSYTYWNENFWKGVYSKNEWMLKNAARRRADLLYKLPSKVELTKKILSELKGRTIVFGNSLDALLEVTPNVVSSRNTDSVNDEIKRRYNEGSIDVLGSFKKLKQGINLEGLDNVVMMGYYSKALDFIQRSGRIRVQGTDFVGNLVILRTSGTKEDDWYDKMLAGIDTTIICDGFSDFVKKYHGRL